MPTEHELIAMTQAVPVGDLFDAIGSAVILAAMVGLLVLLINFNGRPPLLLALIGYTVVAVGVLCLLGLTTALSINIYFHGVLWGSY